MTEPRSDHPDVSEWLGHIREIDDGRVPGE
jgi:hypothetical protein